jgi:hypothetical protein
LAENVDNNSRIQNRRQVIHELADNIGISYDVFQKVLKGNLNMCCIAAMFIPRLNQYRVIIPHPPYSLDLTPCDFTLFPQLKMKLKREILKRRLTFNGNRKW